jgi:hypothetical protein
VLGGARESVNIPEGGIRDSRNGTKIGRVGKITEETTAGLILSDGKRKTTADRKMGLGGYGQLSAADFFSATDC